MVDVRRAYDAGLGPELLVDPVRAVHALREALNPR
jgi:hypothetical protein